MKINFRWELRDLGIVLALLFIALVVVYGCYTPFSLDDYEYAYLLKNFGFIGAMKERYLLWHGRFSSNFFILAYHAIANIPRGFNFSALINCFFLIGTMSLFQTRLIGLEGTKKKILGVLVLVVFSLAASPFLHSILLWWTGSATYLIGFFFAILSLWMSDRLIRKSAISNWPLHFILVMIAAGMNEMNFIFLFLGNMYIWWIYHNKVDPNRWRQTALFNFFCLSTAALAVLLSPGQEIQNETLKLIGTHDLGTSILGVLQLPYYSEVKLTDFSLIILGTLCYLTLNPELKTKISSKHLITLGLIVALAILAVNFAAYWNQGITNYPNTVPPRISGVLIILLFLFFSLCAVRLFQEVKTTWKGPRAPQWANSLILIFLLLTAIYHHNGSIMIQGLFDRTQQTLFYLDKAMHERIEVSKGADLELTLPTVLMTKKKTLFPLLNIYRANKNYWYNQLLCRYHGCTSLSFHFADDLLWIEMMRTHTPEYFEKGHHEAFMMLR